MIVGCSYYVPGFGDKYFNVLVDRLEVGDMEEHESELIEYINMEQVNIVDRIEYLMNDYGKIVWENK